MTPQDQLGRADELITLDQYEEELSRKFGVPLDIIKAVRGLESSNSHLDEKGQVKTSWKGAKGRFQLMPATFKQMGGRNIDDEWDNTYAGIKYLAEGYSKAPPELSDDKRWGAALVYYHGGPGGLNRAATTDTFASDKDAQGKRGMYSNDYANNILAKANKFKEQRLAAEGQLQQQQTQAQQPAPVEQPQAPPAQPIFQKDWQRQPVFQPGWKEGASNLVQTQPPVQPEKPMPSWWAPPGQVQEFRGRPTPEQQHAEAVARETQIANEVVRGRQDTRLQIAQEPGDRQQIEQPPANQDAWTSFKADIKSGLKIAESRRLQLYGNMQGVGKLMSTLMFAGGNMGTGEEIARAQADRQAQQDKLEAEAALQATVNPSWTGDLVRAGAQVVGDVIVQSPAMIVGGLVGGPIGAAAALTGMTAGMQNWQKRPIESVIETITAPIGFGAAAKAGQVVGKGLVGIANPYVRKATAVGAGAVVEGGIESWQEAAVNAPALISGEIGPKQFGYQSLIAGLTGGTFGGAGAFFSGEKAAQSQQAQQQAAIQAALNQPLPQRPPPPTTNLVPPGATSTSIGGSYPGGGGPTNVYTPGAPPTTIQQPSGGVSVPVGGPLSPGGTTTTTTVGTPTAQPGVPTVPGVTQPGIEEEAPDFVPGTAPGVTPDVTEQIEPEITPPEGRVITDQGPRPELDSDEAKTLGHLTARLGTDLPFYSGDRSHSVLLDKDVRSAIARNVADMTARGEPPTNAEGISYTVNDFPRRVAWEKGKTGQYTAAQQAEREMGIEEGFKVSHGAFRAIMADRLAGVSPIESLTQVTPNDYVDWFNENIPAKSPAWRKLRDTFEAENIAWPEHAKDTGVGFDQGMAELEALRGPTKHLNIRPEIESALAGMTSPTKVGQLISMILRPGGQPDPRTADVLANVYTRLVSRATMAVGKEKVYRGKKPTFRSLNKEQFIDQAVTETVKARVAELQVQAEEEAAAAQKAAADEAARVAAEKEAAKKAKRKPKVGKVTAAKQMAKLRRRIADIGTRRTAGEDVAQLEQDAIEFAADNPKLQDALRVAGIMPAVEPTTATTATVEETDPELIRLEQEQQTLAAKLQDPSKLTLDEHQNTVLRLMQIGAEILERRRARDTGTTEPAVTTPVTPISTTRPGKVAQARQAEATARLEAEQQRDYLQGEIADMQARGEDTSMLEQELRDVEAVINKEPPRAKHRSVASALVDARHLLEQQRDEEQIAAQVAATAPAKTAAVPTPTPEPTETAVNPDIAAQEDALRDAQTRRAALAEEAKTAKGSAKAALQLQIDELKKTEMELGAKIGTLSTTPVESPVPTAEQPSRQKKAKPAATPTQPSLIDLVDKQVADAEQQVAKAKENLKQPTTEPTPTAETLKNLTPDERSEVERLKASIKDRFKKGSTGEKPMLPLIGIDPEILVELGQLGALYVKNAFRGFVPWARDMLTEFGEDIKPYLQDIYDSDPMTAARNAWKKTATYEQLAEAGDFEPLAQIKGTPEEKHAQLTERIGDLGKRLSRRRFPNWRQWGAAMRRQLDAVDQWRTLIRENPHLDPEAARYLNMDLDTAIASVPQSAVDEGNQAIMRDYFWDWKQKQERAKLRKGEGFTLPAMPTEIPKNRQVSDLFHKLEWLYERGLVNESEYRQAMDKYATPADKYVGDLVAEVETHEGLIQSFRIEEGEATAPGQRAGEAKKWSRRAKAPSGSRKTPGSKILQSWREQMLARETAETKREAFRDSVEALLPQYRAQGLDTSALEAQLTQLEKMRPLPPRPGPPGGRFPLASLAGEAVNAERVRLLEGDYVDLHSRFTEQKALDIRMTEAINAIQQNYRETGDVSQEKDWSQLVGSQRNLRMSITKLNTQLRELAQTIGEEKGFTEKQRKKGYQKVSAAAKAETQQRLMNARQIESAEAEMASPAYLEQHGLRGAMEEALRTYTGHKRETGATLGTIETDEEIEPGLEKYEEALEGPEAIRGEAPIQRARRTVEAIFPRSNWLSDTKPDFAVIEGFAKLDSHVHGVEGNEGMSNVMGAALTRLKFGGDWRAVALPRKFIPKLTAELRTLGDKGIALADHLDKTAKGPLYGERVLYFNTGDRITNDALYDAVLHEVGHQFNVDAGGNVSPWAGKMIAKDAAYKHLKEGIGTLEGNPEVADSVIEKEAPAYVLSGQWKRLGFKTHAQAKGFLKRYVKRLAADHGSAGLERWPFLKSEGTDTLSNTIREVLGEIERKAERSGIKAASAKGGGATAQAAALAGVLPAGSTGVQGGGRPGIGQARGPVVQGTTPGGLTPAGVIQKNLASAGRRVGQMTAATPTATTTPQTPAKPKAPKPPKPVKPPKPPKPTTPWQRFMQQMGTFQAGAQLLTSSFGLTNVAGGGTQMALRQPSRLGAVLYDIARTKLRGEKGRTVMTSGLKTREAWENLMQGKRMEWETIKAGGVGRILSPHGGRQNVAPATKFPSPGLYGKTGRTIERGLAIMNSLADAAFYEAAFQDSLENQMRAQAADPTSTVLGTFDDIVVRAELEANQAVFNDVNNFSKLTMSIKHRINSLTGHPDWGAASLMGLHYPRIPANLLKAGLEHSPVGLITPIFRLAKQLATGNPMKDPRGTALLAGRALTGTAIPVTMGVMLAASGILYRPDDDKDRYGLDSEEGLGRYQINLSALARVASGGFIKAMKGDWSDAKAQKGDHLVSYDWLQPIGISTSLGAGLMDLFKKKGWGGLVDFAGNLDEAVTTLADQSIVGNIIKLTALVGSAEGGRSDRLNRQLKTMAASAPAGFVPRIAQQLRFAIDPKRRDLRPESPIDSPTGGLLEETGLRLANTLASPVLPARPGVFGQREVDQSDVGIAGRLGLALVPAKYSAYKGTQAGETLRELDMSPAQPRRLKGEPTSYLREREVAVGRRFKQLMDQNVVTLKQVNPEQRKELVEKLRKEAAGAIPHSPADIRRARARAGFPPVVPE